MLLLKLRRATSKLCELSEILWPARSIVPVFENTPFRAPQLKLPWLLCYFIILQSKLQDIYAQRFVSRFHYLVFNVHRRHFQSAFAFRNEAIKNHAIAWITVWSGEENFRRGRFQVRRHPHSVALAARRSLLFGLVTKDSIHQPRSFCQPLCQKFFNPFWLRFSAFPSSLALWPGDKI